MEGCQSPPTEDHGIRVPIPITAFLRFLSFSFPSGESFAHENQKEIFLKSIRIPVNATIASCAKGVKPIWQERQGKLDSKRKERGNKKQSGDVRKDECDSGISAMNDFVKSKREIKVKKKEIKSCTTEADEQTITPKKGKKQTFTSGLEESPCVEETPICFVGSVISLAANTIEQSVTKRSSYQHPKLCELCGTSYPNLSFHMKSAHKDLKKHKCDKCAKSFTEKSTLSSHVNAVHLNLREHKCDICGKDFGHSSTLFKHKKLVHFKKVELKCGACKTSFELKKDLNSHIRVVHLNMKDKS